jgi:hypothetical protein
MNLEQWGGTVGGPIIKNKLFYFGAFERETYSVGNAFPTSTPTSQSIGDPTQSIPDAEAALLAKGVPISPLSTHLLPYFGTNNNPTSAITIGFPDVFTINNVVAKGDYHLNDHHAFTSSFFYGAGDSTGEDAAYTLAIFNSIGKMRAELLTTSWTWTPNSSWVNDLRFGWNHYLRNTQTGDYLTPASTYGLNTGITDPQLQGFPLITISGFSSSAGGGPKSPRNFGPGNDYDVVDHISWLRGKHAFKFGGEMLYLRTFFDQIPNGRGTITFSGGKNLTDGPAAFSTGAGKASTMTALEAYLAGYADTSSGGSLLEGSPARTYTQLDFSGFFEDTWRVTSKVTATMGIRYEYYTPISEINNLIGNFSLANGLEQVGVNGMAQAYNGYKKDLSPRFGVAWDISGKGTTVIRAGAGIYFDNPATAQYIALQGTLPGGQIGIDAIPTGSLLYAANGSVSQPVASNGSGMSTQTVQIPGANLNWALNGVNPLFPAFSPTNLACGNGLAASAAPGGAAPGVPVGFKNPGQCSIYATNPNLPSPMITSWNLGVQHALTSNMALDVNYIGNHGSRLPGVIDLNQPGSGSCNGNFTVGGNTCWPLAAQYPYLAYVDYLQNNEVSNYNALEATLTARNFHHLSFLAGYAFSHALSEEPGTGYGVAVAQNTLDPMSDYGPTPFDIRHHFTFTPSYAIPGIKSPLQLLEGWSVQATTLFTTGTPWTATDSTNLSGTLEKKDRWDFFGNSSDFTQTSHVIPYYPGNNIAAMPTACTSAAAAIGTTATSLVTFGCYAQNGSVLIAPPPNTFGTSTRGNFRGPNYNDIDFSVIKNQKVKEWLTAQFRVEFFNVINHPILYTGTTNPKTNSTFGCACQSPDQAQTNPVLGTGGARNLQLGLKLIF